MEFHTGSKLNLTSDFLLSPSPVSPWGLHRAWPGRKSRQAQRCPVRADGAFCTQGELAWRGRFLCASCLRPRAFHGLKSFQVLRPGAQCQILPAFTILGNIPYDATVQATLTWVAGIWGGCCWLLPRRGLCSSAQNDAWDDRLCPSPAF